MILRTVAVALVGGIVAFLVITWCALEWSGVAVVNTTTNDGTNRTTHVWFIDRDTHLLLEAGTPENGWFVDVRKKPRLRISQPSDLAGDYRVELRSSPEGHAHIRTLMHEKYGLRDAWIGALFDTTRSIEVRVARMHGRTGSLALDLRPADSSVH